jgi:hypothetical protein
MIALVIVIVCTAVNVVLDAGNWALHADSSMPAICDGVGRLLDSDGVGGRHAEAVYVAGLWALYRDDRKETRKLVVDCDIQK